MGENFGNHRGIFNGGNDFQGTTTVWAMLNVDIEYSFEQPGPAHVASSRVMGGIAQIIWTFLGDISGGTFLGTQYLLITADGVRSRITNIAVFEHSRQLYWYSI
jgi:hypothetical protein